MSWISKTSHEWSRSNEGALLYGDEMDGYGLRAGCCEVSRYEHRPLPIFTSPQRSRIGLLFGMHTPIVVGDFSVVRFSYALSDKCFGFHAG